MHLMIQRTVFSISMLEIHGDTAEDNRGFDFHDGNVDVIGSPRWSNITLSNGTHIGHARGFEYNDVDRKLQQIGQTIVKNLNWRSGDML